MKLTEEELQRYSRHMVIPEVGIEGQERLKNSSVLLVGVGGLGSPVAYYLAAAGVGRLGLVDYDIVDRTNLQRQILHFDTDVGKAKLQSAKQKLLSLNPDIEIELHETKLTRDNALSIFETYDVIVDGTDNFPTRYLVNDACVLYGKPNVYGSIFRFEGQVSVFFAKEGACYRCLYPEPPPPGLIPSCADAGVLGVLPGVIGSLQATEVLKLLLGIGEPLVGTLLSFDALRMEFSAYRVTKDPECPICGKNPTITQLIDYEDFCGLRERRLKGRSVPEITVHELEKMRSEGIPFLLLDVREDFELKISRLDPCVHIPMGEVAKRMSELPRDREIVVLCRSGNRSKKVTEDLLRSGFRKVSNLAGGINAYAREINPSIQAY
ncbi:MAG TPA: molybdopterin-synthase adenylyltransferase MoeB [Fimbriimonadales bacterium]|nr:molybdopterin-synthase adenylyltransferase MoeB [Fimbriimonadales bacterium]